MVLLKVTSRHEWVRAAIDGIDGLPEATLLQPLYQRCIIYLPLVLDYASGDFHLHTCYHNICGM